MKPKQFFYGLLGALAVLVVAAGLGYYFALERLHTEAAAQSAALAAQIQAETEINSLQRLQVQYNHTIVPILPTIDEALPRQKKQTEILAQLQNIASGVGLSITSVNMPAPIGLPTAVSQTVQTGAVLALPISFQLSGTYEQLQSFTQAVENLNRFTNITNLAVSHPDKSQSIVYSISLNAYIKP
jgi:Tfp pilus assembly protein PilO